MVERRFTVDVDEFNDCLTIHDKEEKLHTSFDSDICLYPLEDAGAVIDELNVQCATVAMLREHLEMYEDAEDIKYWIDEVREDME